MLHTIPSMLGKFLEHSWSKCGGLNPEPSLFVVYLLTKIGFSSFKYKHYLPGCATSGKRVLILQARQPMEMHMELTDENSH